MMKKILSFSVLLSAVVFIFASSQSYSGELQFLWSKNLDSGVVYDMEFMPDNNYFIMSTTSGVQIRKTETGEIFNSLNFYAANIEFSPDSTKLIITNGWDKIIQTRNISDMSLIKEYALADSVDTTGYDFSFSYLGLKEIVIDPVRPLIYAIRERSGQSHNGQSIHIQKLIIYNYETMEEVGKLTIPAEETSYYKDIAISKDGKYLAAITENTSFIKVWDLNTREKIRDFKVCSYYPNIGGGEPAQLTFSQINTDNIYFSGSFPQSKDTWYDGILIYDIIQNKIVDSTFAVGPLSVGFSGFCLFDYEERSIAFAPLKILVLNFKLKIREREYLKDTISTGDRTVNGFLRYSNNSQHFISYNQRYFGCAYNNQNVSVALVPSEIKLVYPNPATDYIEIACDNHTLKGVVEDIRIYDILGTDVSAQSTPVLPLSMLGEGKIRLDVSHLAPGVYFVRVGDVVRKFVKL